MWSRFFVIQKMFKKIHQPTVIPLQKIVKSLDRILLLQKWHLKLKNLKSGRLLECWWLIINLTAAVKRYLVLPNMCVSIPPASPYGTLAFGTHSRPQSEIVGHRGGSVAGGDLCKPVREILPPRARKKTHQTSMLLYQALILLWKKHWCTRFVLRKQKGRKQCVSLEDEGPTNIGGGGGEQLRTL